FFSSSRRRHTRCYRDWSSDVCSSDLQAITYWARAIAAGRLRDAAAARAAITQYEAMIEATRKGKEAYVAKYMDTGRDEARAWLRSEGRRVGKEGSSGQ